MWQLGLIAREWASFRRLIRNVCGSVRKKFNVKKEDLYVTLDDDTEVDKEYFEILQSGTHLYIKSRKLDKPPDSLHQLATFLHKCLVNQPKIHDKVTEYLQKPEQATHILGLLAQVAEASCSPSKGDDDLDWFKGLNTRFRTKESVMRNSAETRMRSYLEQAKKMLLSDDLPANSPCRKALNFFKEQLSKSKYNADYFDRLAPSGARLCDGNGVFECEGPYNQSSCDGTHIINPYNSREARIVFSTWNLDHVIEKSRSILPVLKSALQGRKSSAVNLPYFHSLLFLHQCLHGQTVSGNLKLVHVACHDKKPHEIKCKSSQVYLNIGKTTENHDAITDCSDDDTTDGFVLQHCKLTGMNTRQSLKSSNGMCCYNDVTDGFIFQPRPSAGMITRQRWKRGNEELYAGGQKRRRLMRSDS